MPLKAGFIMPCRLNGVIGRVIGSSILLISGLQ